MRRRTIASISASAPPAAQRSTLTQRFATVSIAYSTGADVLHGSLDRIDAAGLELFDINQLDDGESGPSA